MQKLILPVHIRDAKMCICVSANLQVKIEQLLYNSLCNYSSYALVTFFILNLLVPSRKRSLIPVDDVDGTAAGGDAVVCIIRMGSPDDGKRINYEG